MANLQVARDLKQLKEAWDGLDFIMELFEGPKFPRTIATGATSRRQYTVHSRDEAMTYFEAAIYEDIYINAYLNYEWMAKNGEITQDFKPIPNYVIIDLDRDRFESDEEFEAAPNITLQNIKSSFTGLITEHQIVVASGNGYHVHVPLPGFQTPLQDMPEFAAFKDDPQLPNKFLQWAEDTLSNGMADQHHNPAINSSLFRVPGTLNTKARDRGRDPRVRIVQGMEYVVAKIAAEQSSLPDIQYKERASKPTTKFLNDFLGHLIQELIDEKVEKLQRRKYNLIHIGNNNHSIVWIDKLLQTGVEDDRKNLLYWVLAPYLMTIRSIDFDKAYHILEGWLDKCNEVRRLEPDRTAFRYRIRYCLDTVENQERMPIRYETFKEYYPDVYKSLKLSWND